MTRSPSLKPSASARLSVWGGVALLTLSGLALTPAAWFGEERAPFAWEASRGWIAALHGGLALLFTLLLGALLPHIQAGLKARRNLAWGLGLLACLALLLLSAWGLYYWPPESQGWNGPLHALLGLLLPALVGLHAWMGRRPR